MSYTKGEWEVFDDAEECKFIIMGKDGVCVVHYGNNNFEEQNANAQLISAAPDLLEACRLAFSELKEFCELSSKARGRQICTNAMIKLQQAINKAEGK